MVSVGEGESVDSGALAAGASAAGGATPAGVLAREKDVHALGEETGGDGERGEGGEGGVSRSAGKLKRAVVGMVLSLLVYWYKSIYADATRAPQIRRATGRVCGRADLDTALPVPIQVYLYIFQVWVCVYVARSVNHSLYSSLQHSISLDFFLIFFLA